MDELQTLMEWNRAFAKNNFPKNCDDPVASLNHLKEEIIEIIEAIMNNESSSDVLEEYADALILLTGSAIRSGFSSKQLIYAAFNKMEKNEKRE